MAATAYDRDSNAIVYLDILIGEEHVGRLVIELRADIAPSAAENFRMICAGETVDQETGKVRTYKGSIFHRVTLDINCQGGDYENGDGSGGTSAYKTKTFEDENFILRHTGPGVLSMVNSGPDSNKSSFFISFAATSWLDNRHVVFGALLGEESFRILARIQDVATESGEPLKPVMITECGQLFPY